MNDLTLCRCSPQRRESPNANRRSVTSRRRSSTHTRTTTVLRRPAGRSVARASRAFSGTVKTSVTRAGDLRALARRGLGAHERRVPQSRRRQCEHGGEDGERDEERVHPGEAPSPGAPPERHGAPRGRPVPTSRVANPRPARPLAFARQPPSIAVVRLCLAAGVRKCGKQHLCRPLDEGGLVARHERRAIGSAVRYLGVRAETRSHTAQVALCPWKTLTGPGQPSRSVWCVLCAVGSDARSDPRLHPPPAGEGPDRPPLRRTAGRPAARA